MFLSQPALLRRHAELEAACSKVVRADEPTDQIEAAIYECRDQLLGQHPETIEDLRTLLAFALDRLNRDPGVHQEEIDEALRLVDERLASMRT
jgi:hypothetical protein